MLDVEVKAFVDRIIKNSTYNTDKDEKISEAEAIAVIKGEFTADGVSITQDLLNTGKGERKLSNGKTEPFKLDKKELLNKINNTDLDSFEANANIKESIGNLQVIIFKQLRGLSVGTIIPPSPGETKIAVSSAANIPAKLTPSDNGDSIPSDMKSFTGGKSYTYTKRIDGNTAEHKIDFNAHKLDDLNDFTFYIDKDLNVHFVSYLRKPNSEGKRPVTDIVINSEKIKLENVENKSIYNILIDQTSKYSEDNNNRRVQNSLVGLRGLDKRNISNILYLSNENENPFVIMNDASKDILLKARKYTSDKAGTGFAELLFEQYIKPYLNGDSSKLRAAKAEVRYADNPDELEFAKVQTLEPFKVFEVQPNADDQIAIGVLGEVAKESSSIAKVEMPSVSGNNKTCHSKLSSYKGLKDNNQYFDFSYWRRKDDGNLELTRTYFKQNELIEKFKEIGIIIDPSKQSLDKIRDLFLKHVVILDKNIDEKELYELKQKQTRPVIFLGEIKGDKGATFTCEGADLEKLKGPYNAAIQSPTKPLNQIFSNGTYDLDLSPDEKIDGVQDHITATIGSLVLEVSEERSKNEYRYQSNIPPIRYYDENDKEIGTIVIIPQLKGTTVFFEIGGNVYECYGSTRNFIEAVNKETGRDFSEVVDPENENTEKFVEIITLLLKGKLHNSRKEPNTEFDRLFAIHSARRAPSAKGLLERKFERSGSGKPPRRQAPDHKTNMLDERHKDYK